MLLSILPSFLISLFPCSKLFACLLTNLLVTFFSSCVLVTIDCNEHGKNVGCVGINVGWMDCDGLVFE